MRASPHNSGFTLIELSIVLVIIGLIVGGVLVGRDLIHSASLRQVISDVEKFKTAVNTFRSKYNCLPGDCANATEFFGTSSTCSAVGTYDHSGTCNGNGDGMIVSGNGLYSAPAGQTTNYHPEHLLFWQQLSLAGLIPGSYDSEGVGGAAGGNFATGSPVSNAFPSLCYSLMYTGPEEPQDISSAMYESSFVGHLYTFGLPQGTGTGMAYCGMTGGVSGPDAYSIDMKIDDGSPASGNVSALEYSFTPSGVYSAGVCGGPWPGPYAYTSGPNLNCMLLFNAGF